ncbi:MAG: thioredoxin [Lautropia sp.]
MIDVTQQSFESEVIAASHRVPVLVDFWAPWCAPCRALGPVLEKAEDEAAGAFKLVKVNSDDNPELARALGIRGIPNVVLFKDGQPADQFVGAQPESRIRAFLARHVERPGDREIVKAREALAEKRYAEAATALSVVLAINPADAAARADYVIALTKLGRYEQARTAFAPLAGTAVTDLRLAAVGRMLDASEVAAGAEGEAELRAALDAAPSDHTRRMSLANWLIAHGRWAEALEQLLHIASSDRSFGDDLARRSMLAVFELCGDPALVAAYRRKLSAALN